MKTLIKSLLVIYALLIIVVIISPFDYELILNESFKIHLIQPEVPTYRKIHYTVMLILFSALFIYGSKIERSR